SVPALAEGSLTGSLEGRIEMWANSPFPCVIALVSLSYSFSENEKMSRSPGFGRDADEQGCHAPGGSESGGFANGLISTYALGPSSNGLEEPDSFVTARVT